MSSTARSKRNSGKPYSFLGIRMSPEQREKLDKAAERDNRKVSSWAKIVLIRAAGQQAR